MIKSQVLPVSLLCILLGALLPNFSADAAGTNATPRQVDLRPEFNRWKLPLRQQGTRNTCSVMTTVGALEFALARRQDRGVPLSPEYLNWACNQVIKNQTADRGQFFHDLLAGYERYGICPDSQMRYIAKFSPQYKPSEQAMNSASQIRTNDLRAHWIKKHDGKVGVSEELLEQARATLRQGWPVCGGSYHSVLLVGYRDDSSLPGGGEFIIRDSGNNQNTTMSYQEAKARLCDLIWYDIGSTKDK
jgi:C1A family cysteine protease